MNTQQFFKGLLMALVAVLVTAVSTTPINWILIVVTTIAVILTYVGKNLITVLHSNSPVGALSWINALSGVLVALGTGLLDGFTTYFVTGAILWPVVWKLVISITLTYFGTTFFAPPYNTGNVKVFVK
jgi:hypothetical protein